MKHGIPWCLAGLAAVAQLVGAARIDPPLPEWREGDRELMESAGFVAGALLLGDESAEGGDGEVVAAVAVPAPEPYEEAEGAEESVAEIPEEFLDAYFLQRPEGLLVDPQNLLSRQEYEDLNEFLRRRSGDSGVDLVVYLFDAEQEIPDGVMVEELVERFFSGGRPTAVVLYFFGAPRRAQLLLSPQLIGVVSGGERRAALDRSVARALEKSNPVDQLEGFAVQVSNRLYWMERMLGGGALEDDAPLVALPEREKVEPGPGAVERFEAALALAMPWWRWILGGAGCVAALVLGFWLWRRYFRYRFPEIDVPPRLGGRHGAGIGAVITFSSIALPPSVQRKSMPDYVKGL